MRCLAFAKIVSSSSDNGALTHFKLKNHVSFSARSLAVSGLIDVTPFKEIVHL